MRRTLLPVITVGFSWGAVAAHAQGAPPPVSLADRVNAAVQLIEQDICFQTTDGSDCEWTNPDTTKPNPDVEISHAQFKMVSSTGAQIKDGPAVLGGAEAILVVDSFDQGLYPQLVRYRNRLAAIYQVNRVTDSVEVKPLRVHLPRRLADVLTSFAGPEFIPASALTPVAQAASAVYDKLALSFLGHGGVVLGHLTDLVPEQPIVLLDMTHLLELPPEVCDGVTAANLDAARQHFVKLANSLRSMMFGHNIRYINASFGSTADTVRAEWQNTCGTEPPGTGDVRALLGVYAPLYDALFNSWGVIAAHASATLGAAADFPFDQSSAAYPNQVRAGYFSSKRSGINADGTGTLSKNDQFPAAVANADVFLNWECLFFGDCAPVHYECVATYGLATVTLPIMSTSYVTPLALARLINLRNQNHAGQDMTNQLVATLKSELTPSRCGSSRHDRCVYQDPIEFELLEVYRLHYK